MEKQHEKAQQAPQTAEQPKQVQNHLEDEEEIPDHFYDSDLASINEKDFLSDHEPPKDSIEERKLLYKEKLLHVHKTIIRLGNNIQKPARYDLISLRFKEVPQKEVVPFPIKKQQQAQYKHPDHFSTQYLMDEEPIEYNLGKNHEDIERLVTSMKRGEAAVFQLEHLQVNKKNNIKKRVKVEVYVIWVDTWTTVIDVDCDGKIMKEVVTRGQGHSRIAKHDQVCFEFKITQGNAERFHVNHKQHVKLQQAYLDSMPHIFWKLLYSMKEKEKIRVVLTDEVVRQIEGEKYQELNKSESKDDWVVEIQIFHFHSIDDIYLDGKILKKTIIKGVSTAKPDSASLAYFALQIYSPQGTLLHEDSCWNSDWWEDLQKLDLLNCRKHYLDDHSISLLLKQSIKRMKPAEIAQIDCRDKTFFTYGTDYEQYKKLTGLEQIPDRVKLGVRLYNFSQGKNAFNMELEEKVIQAKRKKPIGVKYIQQGNIPRALRTFEAIVSYFSSGKINHEAYEQKVSALMNCTLCHMKNQNYTQMLKLCNQILEAPRHGYDPTKMKIKGPGHAKIEGKLPDEPDSGDQRQVAEVPQNQKILDKCLYRKAFALTRMGEGGQALECLQKISAKSEEVITLEKEAQKLKAQYEKKSVKMFKNMFG